jgi:hypothetical protein
VAEICQHHLRTSDGTVWPCTRTGPHTDGWHERVTTAVDLVSGAIDVDYDRVERPAVAGLVLRWRERFDSDDVRT